MAWIIACSDVACRRKTCATNIVGLLDNHRNTDGCFVSYHCGARGHIEKSFQLQTIS